MDRRHSTRRWMKFHGMYQSKCIMNSALLDFKATMVNMVGGTLNIIPNGQQHATLARLSEEATLLGSKSVPIGGSVNYENFLGGENKWGKQGEAKNDG